ANHFLLSLAAGVSPTRGDPRRCFSLLAEAGSGRGPGPHKNPHGKSAIVFGEFKSYRRFVRTRKIPGLQLDRYPLVKRRLSILSTIFHEMTQILLLRRVSSYKCCRNLTPRPLGRIY